MVKKTKEQKEQEQDQSELRKLILDYLQENGLQLRKQYGVADARLAENPVRLVLTMTYGELSPDTFKNLTFRETSIPVEIQNLDVKPVIVTGNVAAGEGAVESETKAEQTDAFHHEFSKKAAEICGIKETVGPNVSADDARGKTEAYDAWKKRHKGVKIIGE